MHQFIGSSDKSELQVNEIDKGWIQVGKTEMTSSKHKWHHHFAPFNEILIQSIGPN